MLRKLAITAALALGLFSASPAFPANSANLQTKIALNRNLPTVDFTGVSLRDALDFVRDVTGVNLHINWRAIEASGVTPDSQVNIKMRQVSLRKLLNMLLSEAAGGNTLAYYLDDGVIEITTRDIADSKMYTLVYPVQDLLVEPPEFDQPPEFQLESNSGGGSGGGRGGGGSGGGRGGGGGQTNIFGQQSNQSQSSQQRDPTAKANELLELIRSTVYPDTWIENGGKSSIKFFNGNLIITAPRSVHEAIGGSPD